ncbi:hypothetical protein Anapl_02777 [Anas platyrhynchos]|uniref:Uncharacterized protein n=1 Tax=Anas platyrhynchos TaxID=8839 RepID=R0K3J2_ANAPL|nr:hypothetical protein Anapl_02777 [Anas platyrhynchos]
MKSFSLSQPTALWADLARYSLYPWVPRDLLTSAGVVMELQSTCKREEFGLCCSEKVSSLQIEVEKTVTKKALESVYGNAVVLIADGERVKELNWGPNLQFPGQTPSNSELLKSQVFCDCEKPNPDLQDIIVLTAGDSLG